MTTATNRKVKSTGTLPSVIKIRQPIAAHSGGRNCILQLRYHGRWIFKKIAKNFFFAVQIEKTEKNNSQKEWRKKLFYFLR